MCRRSLDELVKYVLSVVVIRMTKVLLVHGAGVSIKWLPL